MPSALAVSSLEDLPPGTSMDSILLTLNCQVINENDNSYKSRL